MGLIEAYQKYYWFIDSAGKGKWFRTTYTSFGVVRLHFLEKTVS